MFTDGQIDKQNVVYTYKGIQALEGKEILTRATTRMNLENITLIEISQLPLLLLLSRFSRVRLCATPQMAAHQASPSLGFSRQEHWSGLPFPTAMHESEKLKLSGSVVSDSQRLHGLQPTRPLRPWDFPGKSTGVGCHFLLRISHLQKDKYCMIPLK